MGKAMQVDMGTSGPIDLVRARAAQRSADFIEANGEGALLFARKPKLWDFVATKVPVAGLMGECGVFEGRSINHMARIFAERDIFGFDSFEGLEEDWPGLPHAAGHFDLGGALPSVESNVTLTKGWVQDTIPTFLENHAGPIAFLHVDTDTYAPAKSILSLCKPRFVPGTVVLFDELIGYPFWERAEYRALQEELGDTEYRFIAFSSMQAAIVIGGGA